MTGVAIDSSELGPEPLQMRGLARLDTRTRIIAAMIFVLAVVSTNSLAALGVAILSALALAAFNGQRLRALARRLAHVEGFLVVLFVLLPFTIPGEALFSVGPFVASDAGVLRTITIALKVNAAVIGIFALLGSLEPARLGGALARLGVPHSLVHLLLFTIRYAALFRGEMQRLLESMRARAFRPRSNWHTWRSYGNLAGMMLIRSFERAERVDEAMRCRAFSGRLSLAADGRMTWRDGCFLAAMACIVAALIMWGRLA